MRIVITDKVATKLGLTKPELDCEGGVIFRAIKKSEIELQEEKNQILLLFQRNRIISRVVARLATMDFENVSLCGLLNQSRDCWEKPEKGSTSEIPSEHDRLLLRSIDLFKITWLYSQLKEEILKELKSTSLVQKIADELEFLLEILLYGYSKTERNKFEDHAQKQNELKQKIKMTKSVKEAALLQRELERLKYHSPKYMDVKKKEDALDFKERRFNKEGWISFLRMLISDLNAEYKLEP